MPDFLAGLCDPDTLQMLAEGTLDTLYMTLASTFFAYVFGHDHGRGAGGVPR